MEIGNLKGRIATCKFIAVCTVSMLVLLCMILKNYLSHSLWMGGGTDVFLVYTVE